jgi:hypothetical protein
MSEGGRARGRKGKAKMNEIDFEPANGKRKRGGNNKSMSVTPSAMDDDEEDRDLVCRVPRSTTEVLLDIVATETTETQGP